MKTNFPFTLDKIFIEDTGDRSVGIQGHFIEMKGIGIEILDSEHLMVVIAKFKELGEWLYDFRCHVYTGQEWDALQAEGMEDAY